MESTQETDQLIPAKSAPSRKQSKLRFFMSLGIVLIVFKGSEEMSITCFKQYVYFWCEQYLNKTDSSTATNTSADNVVDAKSTKTDGCNTNNASASQEDEAQAMASQWQMYYDILGSVLVFISTSVLGTLSDYIGRRKVGLIAMFGFAMRCCIITVVVYFDLHIAYFLAAYAIDGVCGSFQLFSLFSYSSGADLTDNVRDRVMAVAIIEGMIGTGLFSTDISTGYFIKNYGFFYPNLTASCGIILGFTLALFLLIETNTSMSNKNIQSDGKPLRPTCGTLFQNYVGFYTNREQKGKRIFWLSLIVFFLLEFVIMGKGNPLTLYQLGRPFCWGSELIGWYSGANLAATYMIGVVALKPMLHVVSEHVAACVGLISLITSNVITGLATSTVDFFFAIGAGFLGTMPKSIIRGMVSSRAAGEKQGAVFAGLQSSELVCKLLSAPICLSIYSHTLDTMRGTVFLILAGVCGVNLLFQVWLSILVRREEKTKDVTIIVEPQ